MLKSYFQSCYLFYFIFQHTIFGSLRKLIFFSFEFYFEFFPLHAFMFLCFYASQPSLSLYLKKLFAKGSIILVYIYLSIYLYVYIYIYIYIYTYIYYSKQHLLSCKSTNDGIYHLAECQHIHIKNRKKSAYPSFVYLLKIIPLFCFFLFGFIVYIEIHEIDKSETINGIKNVTTSYWINNFSKVSLHFKKMSNSLRRFLYTYSEICMFCMIQYIDFQKWSMGGALKVLRKIFEKCLEWSSFYS